MITPEQVLDAALAYCPLVAILRGVRPNEVVAIADAIVEAGFSMIEVPLNSPDPLNSIALLAKRYGPDVLIGAGTVLTVPDVEAVHGAGGRLVVSPNVNPSVIQATAVAGMVSLPGFFTPTEAFAALEAGATGLKLYPAEGGSPAYLKAMRAVLPRDKAILAVGGISVENLGEWMAYGARGAGIGSTLYQAGYAAEMVRVQAQKFALALKQI